MLKTIKLIVLPPGLLRILKVSLLRGNLPNWKPAIPQLSQDFIIAPRFPSNYTQQASLGGDYFVNSQTTISLTYTYVRGLRLLLQRQINPIIRPNSDPIVNAFGRADPTH